MKTKSRYEKRGVSSRKEGVHKAIARLDRGLFPGAFCKILPDYLGDSPEYCNIIHSDGGGTKAALMYLATRVRKISSGILRELCFGLAQDSMVMNTDDVGCVFPHGPFIANQTINRNAFRITDEMVAALIEGCEQFCQKLHALGITCVFGGGETADVGDLVRTFTIDNTVVARPSRRQIIDAANMAPGDIIVGFSSTGQAAWEREENSGIGDNGLTNARHDVLASIYRDFTETYSPEMPKEAVYTGEYRLDDLLPGAPRFSIQTALLSPTRTYLPLMQMLAEGIPPHYLHGLIHCSGGGQTKIGRFGQPGNVYWKDNLFPVPPLFAFLQRARALPWDEMWSTYNMGHRLEAVVSSMHVAKQCISIAKHACRIDARIIGEVRRGRLNERRVVIVRGKKRYSYSFGL